MRYVRANTLSGATRAAAEELYTVAPTTTEEMYQASKIAGSMRVLNAIAPEQADVEVEARRGPPAGANGADPKAAGQAARHGGVA